MLKVGLTGNIASGKSSVARVWKSLGAAVVDADELARLAVEPGSPGLAAIVQRWGPTILDDLGALDRAEMRRIVFADAAEREALEAIVHPAVAALRDQGYEAFAARGEDLVVADIPLLFEVGMQDEFDVVVLVDAPDGVRHERLVGHRGLDPREAREMMSAQIPAVLKRAAADLVIENAGTLADLEVRAAAAWEELRVRAARDAEIP